MNCPECKSESRVLQSRQRKDVTWRRRECEKCGLRFSTTEEIREVTKERKDVALRLLDAVEKALIPDR